MDLGEVGWGDVDWIGLAKDRNRWRAVVNSVLNLRVRALFRVSIYLGVVSSVLRWADPIACVDQMIKDGSVSTETKHGLGEGRFSPKILFTTVSC
jgi:hypothetical protein